MSVAVAIASAAEWTDEPDRCRRAGVPDDSVQQEKWRIALGLLDTLRRSGSEPYAAPSNLSAPNHVVDADDGKRNNECRNDYFCWCVKRRDDHSRFRQHSTPIRSVFMGYPDGGGEE
ncbi:transposase [Streptomyces daghestanicus]|uniref:Transposase IS701-like DDE domain-containing protein n=1 Tax=Streptomyces daghestanicus TaxID=66885 RepID=A0ABQ3Q7S5_9ACTN|nr:transposase [Streptomyces daghestanicus]GGU62674.1 hypothetical protein GCM10010259_61650 [Streptomyces daghestanicus]GHI33319.1 hypothetical protein Sdagh_50490 [Streptomyces daghestanicus]